MSDGKILKFPLCARFVNIFFADKEPPTVDFCEAPPIFLVQNESDLKKGQAEVEWSPPIFHDNSLQDVFNMTLLIENEIKTTLAAKHVFPIGKSTHVTYEARDKSGNVAKCEMEITVQGKI